MSRLRGARIALLEARMGGELVNLVRRHGGEPIHVPAVCEVPRESGEQIATLVDTMAQGSSPVVVFLTGMGASVLFQEAERLGRLSELMARLREGTLVCRGPKPAAVLQRLGLPVSLNASTPYTTTEVLAELADLELAGASVTVVHHGERNEALTAALAARAARVMDLCLYEWLLPADLQPLRTLVADLIAGHLDAVAFTSQVQVRHLLRVATALGRADELVDALTRHTVVAAIGPTCATALRSYGIWPPVVPAYPKMGHLVLALASYLGQREPPRWPAPAALSAQH